MSRAKQRKLAANFYPGWQYRFYRARYALGMIKRMDIQLEPWQVRIIEVDQRFWL